jgi:hypothetical protein
MAQDAQIPDPRIIWPKASAPAKSLVFAQNTIEIAAEPDLVWRLLLDCIRWPSWYRHCADVSILRGGPVLDANAKFRFKTIGFYFEPEITAFQPSRMLVWYAKGPAGTRGAHAWYIEPTPGGCRVITEEAQQGLLLHLVRRRTRRTLLESHQDWLQSLKALAEAERPSPSDNGADKSANTGADQ